MFLHLWLLTVLQMQTCGGAAGTIALTVSGGSTPLFLFVDFGGATTTSINGLAAGSYNVTVTDSLGCETVATYNVGTQSSITLGITIQNATCGQADGSISAVPGNGAGGYTIIWSNGHNGITNSGLSAGLYSVTVTDSVGCSIDTTISVGNSNGPVIDTAIVTNIACAGGNTGAVTIVVNGGASGNYTFLWSNSATTQNITGLYSGPYTVTVSDGNGCSASLTANVDTSTAIVIVANGHSPLCTGGNTGTIGVHVSGGAPGYTFQWSLGIGAFTDSLSGLGTGSYTVTVTDTHGCSASTTVNIVAPPQLVLQTRVTNVTCVGGSNGAINTIVTGGQPSYSYYWSDAHITPNDSNLTAGLYSVVVADAFGCSVQATVSVVTLSNLLLNTGATDAYCGDSNGLATVTATGGIAPFTYNLSNNAAITGYIDSNLRAGIYTVTVTDSSGCAMVANIAVSGISTLTIGDSIS